MIDLHAHILPFIDDGADDMETAIDMLDMAKKSGTSVVVATPHCNMPGIFNADVQKIKKIFIELKEELKKRDIDISMSLGMEIFGTEDTAEKLADGRLLTINNTKYPLVEFDFLEDEEYMFFVLEKIIDKGFVPIIAHPERYECFLQNPEKLFEFYKMGVVIQVNKGSVLGRFGERVKNLADIILAHRLAVVAASDAHSNEYRTTVLSDFSECLDDRYGDGCSPLLLKENPKRILQNKDVFWENPLPIFY